jgi:hypothetical protein
MTRGPGSLAPIFLSIDGFAHGKPIEDPVVRDAVDAHLQSGNNKKYSCAVSAMTIFPYTRWTTTGRPPRQKLFEWYLNEFLPRLKARDTHNCNGTYFERMISFQGAKKAGQSMEIGAKNQLDHIVSIWHRDKANGSRPRQSALQVACFDPVKDHTGQPRRGFPCLQQISFSYDDDGGLALTAYYPPQYVFDRGYGNYLGLAQLGEFMAFELGLHLVRLNCLIVHPELGNGVTKGELKHLEKLVRDRLQSESASQI